LYPKKSRTFQERGNPVNRGPGNELGARRAEQFNHPGKYTSTPKNRRNAPTAPGSGECYFCSSTHQMWSKQLFFFLIHHVNRPQCMLA